MNCMDFFHIVDSCDVSRLSATERDACEEHAVACRHCAPHWVAFARLAAIPVLSMPPEVLLRCESLAAIESRVDSKRMGAGRVVVIGAILALAAAAMMMWKMSAGHKTAVAVAEPGPSAIEPVVQPEPDVPAAVAPEPEPSPPAVPADAPPRFTVLVMPLRHEAPDVRKRGAMEALHAAMLVELRKVPGLVLQVPGGSAADAGPANHVLTLSSLATTLSPAGGTMVLGTDGTSRCVERSSSGTTCNPESPPQDLRMTATSGGGSYSSDGTVDNFVPLFGHSLVSDDVVWVELKVEPGSPAGRLTQLVGVGFPRSRTSLPAGTARYTFPAGAGGKPDPQRCPISNGVSTYCMTPAQLATQYVNTLRLQVFPPDARYLQRGLAQLSDPGQAAAGGMSLEELLRALTRGNGSGLDAGTIRALVKYLANQRAKTRANAWTTLRQVSHPGLLAPLLESLRHDPDQEVRLSALTSLLQNHSTDPEVRRALEEIDQEDADPVVRAAVRQALYSPAQWRTDLLAALNDTDLSYEDRLSPLLATSSRGAQLDIETRRMRTAVLQEQQVLNPLIALIREHLHDAAHATATGGALRSLAEVDDPAVFDLFLELAPDSSSLPSEVFLPVGTWAINHAKDPRVRELLPQIEAVEPWGTMLRGLRQGTEQRTAAGEGRATNGSAPSRQTPPAQ